MVKSLQNTKYSIDEKLEKSFISLFGQKPGISLGAGTDDEDTHPAVANIRDIEPSEQYQPREDAEGDEIDEESDAEDLDDSASLDHDEDCLKGSQIKSDKTDSDGENVDTSNWQTHCKDNLMQEVEVHGGRLRRKAVFKDNIYDNEMKVIYPCYFHRKNYHHHQLRERKREFLDPQVGLLGSSKDDYMMYLCNKLLRYIDSFAYLYPRLRI